MSEDRTPEWDRAVRETKALIAGAWITINELSDRLTTLEREFERSTSRPVRRVDKRAAISYTTLDGKDSDLDAGDSGER